MLISTHCADLAREWDCHLMTAHAVQIPKYGQIRTKSRLFSILLLNQPIYKMTTSEKIVFLILLGGRIQQSQLVIQLQALETGLINDVIN